jgi:hypothetical protein
MAGNHSAGLIAASKVNGNKVYSRSGAFWGIYDVLLDRGSGYATYTGTCRRLAVAERRLIPLFFR